jgi:tetratricopeptide (TPR) repeat protein
MEVAVITPFHQTPRLWLNRCLASVACQTTACTHFLVCDGDDPDPTGIPHGVQVLRLPQPHKDFGNAARAIGSVSAISQGFDAITYLDADNWYEPEHIQMLCAAHQRTGAVICSTGRKLFDLTGELLGICPEVDGETFVDTNCLFLTPRAFGLVAAWYLMPKSGVEVGDRIIWKAIKDSKLKRTHLLQASVNYRTRHRFHYRFFGKEPPPGTKDITAAVSARPRRELPLQPVKISLCMIARNEESQLRNCLLSVADLVNEVIVVDTGSTDRTKEIARQCGAKVFDFPWVDDFAAARNESLRQAAGPWILWLDADECFDGENRKRLQQLLSVLGDKNCVYMMKQWSIGEQPNGSSMVVDQARLFRKQPGVGWRLRIHEQILPALQESGAQVVFTDIVLRHVGYQNPALLKQKLERNLRLLQIEHHERPDEPFTMFNLGGTYLDAGDVEKAIHYLQKSIEQAPKKTSFLAKAFVLLAQLKRRLGQLDDGLDYCKEGKAHFPNDVELWFEEGLLRQAKKDSAGAQRCFEHILYMPQRPCFVGLNAGLHGHITRHHLALVHQEQGRPAEAEVHWRAAIKECPNFGPAWLGLAELCLQQRRGGEIQEMIDRLSREEHGKPITSVLRARVCLFQGKYNAARQILQDAVAQAPRSVWLRMLLSDILAHDSQDLESAEKQLNEILAIDPKQNHAVQRLQQIRQKRTGRLIRVPA